MESYLLNRAGLSETADTANKACRQIATNWHSLLASISCSVELPFEVLKGRVIDGSMLGLWGVWGFIFQTVLCLYM